MHEIHVFDMMHPRYSSEIREWRTIWEGARALVLFMYSRYMRIHSDRVYQEQITRNSKDMYLDAPKSSKIRNIYYNKL